MAVVTVEIVDTSIDGSGPVFYKVQHERAGRTWSVRQRYSTLHAMVETLRAQDAVLPSVPFPQKQWNLPISSCAQGMLEKRRNDLETYLRALSGVEDTWECAAVTKVICAGQEPSLPSAVKVPAEIQPIVRATGTEPLLKDETEPAKESATSREVEDNAPSATCAPTCAPASDAPPLPTEPVAPAFEGATQADADAAPSDAERVLPDDTSELPDEVNVVAASPIEESVTDEMSEQPTVIDVASSTVEEVAINSSEPPEAAPADDLPPLAETLESSSVPEVEATTAAGDREDLVPPAEEVSVATESEEHSSAVDVTVPEVDKIPDATKVDAPPESTQAESEEATDLPEQEIQEAESIVEEPVAVISTPEAVIEEAAATESSLTEAHDTEAPDAEACDAEVPDTEAPEAEARDAETPNTEAPDAEAPDCEAPNTEAPDAEVRDAEAPNTEAPDTEAPDTEAPNSEAPDAEAPDTEAPNTEVPDAQVRNTEAPDAEAPDIEAQLVEEEAPNASDAEPVSENRMDGEGEGNKVVESPDSSLHEPPAIKEDVVASLKVTALVVDPEVTALAPGEVTSESLPRDMIPQTMKGTKAVWNGGEVTKMAPAVEGEEEGDSPAASTPLELPPAANGDAGENGTSGSDDVDDASDGAKQTAEPDTEQTAPLARRESLLRRAARSLLPSDKSSVPLEELGSPSNAASSTPRQSGSGRLMSLRNKARNLKNRLSGGGGSGPLSASSKGKAKSFFSMGIHSADDSGSGELSVSTKDASSAASPSSVSSASAADVGAVAAVGAKALKATEDSAVAIGSSENAASTASPPSPVGEA